MSKPVLIVLAAGMGSRYGGLKQIDPMGGHGQAIMDYSVYDAHRAGFEKVIFIIKHSIEKDFKAFVGSRIARCMDVEYVFQELNDLPGGYSVPEGREKPWGTTHAVLAARHMIDGPFAVINSDDYYGPQAFRTMYRYLTSEGGPRCHAMIGYHLGNTLTDFGAVTRGICHMNSDGMLTDIIEQKGVQRDGDGGRYSTDNGKTWSHLPANTLVSMNFWGFRYSFMQDAKALFPLFLDRLLETDPMKGEVYLPLAVDHIMAEGAQVKVLPSTDHWYGVTYLEDKPSVMAAFARMTEEGLYPENLWNE